MRQIRTSLMTGLRPSPGCLTAPIYHHPMVEMTLRFEIFPDDLDVTVNFCTRVLRFRLTEDRRNEPDAYVALQRGGVRVGAVRRRVGAVRRVVPDARAARLPPAGVELVLEVGDVGGERDRVVAAGWPLQEDLQDRPRGLTDFWILDPAGYFLRITDRGPVTVPAEWIMLRVIIAA